MSELRRICLVGVRGVGKTTLVRAVLPQLPGIDHLVGSAILRSLAGEAFAGFDALPTSEKQRHREDAVRWMEDRQAREGHHILCDGHTTLLDARGQVEQVFTEMDCRFFRELILLEATAEVVLERRLRDRSKLRVLDLEAIRAELDGERSSCYQIAERWGMIVHALPPADDPALEARLVEVLST